MKLDGLSVRREKGSKACLAIVVNEIILQFFLLSQFFFLSQIGVIPVLGTWVFRTRYTVSGSSVSRYSVFGSLPITRVPRYRVLMAYAAHVVCCERNYILRIDYRLLLKYDVWGEYNDLKCILE